MIFVILSIIIVKDFIQKIKGRSRKGPLLIIDTIVDFLVLCCGMLLLFNPFDIFVLDTLDTINTIIVCIWIAVKIIIFIQGKFSKKTGDGSMSSEK